MRSEAPAIASPIAQDRDRLIRIAVAVALLVGALGFVFSNFLINQFRFAIQQPADWGHTLVIPFMAGYLIWLRRGSLAPFRTTWPAIGLIIVGIAWYVFCWVGQPAVRHHNLMGLGFGLTLIGVMVLMIGLRAMRYLWFPVAFLLVFGVTISTRFMNIVTEPLQDVAAKGAFAVLRVMQFDADLDGNTISIWHGGEMHPLNVAEACSGMRMVVAFLALAVFMAAICLSRPWQQVLLVLLAVPIAVLVNVLRVVTLGLLGLVNPGFATGDFHSFIGLLWLLPGLFLFYGVIWVIRRLVIESGDVRANKSGRPRPLSARLFMFDHASKPAVIAACLTLLVCGLGFKTAVRALNIYLQKSPVALRRDLPLIPSQLGDWTKHGSDETLDKATIETLGTEDYLSRLYIRDEGAGGAILLHLAYYTDQIDAVPHVPERCVAASGRSPIGGARHVSVPLDTAMWRDDSFVNHRTQQAYQLATSWNPYTRQPYEVRMPILPESGQVELRIWQFQDSRDPAQRLLAGYFFIANGCATSRAEDIRKLAFDRTDEYAYYVKVEFSSIGRGEGAIDAFAESAGDLLKHLLPELMRCLPDWSEVERGLYPVTSTTAGAPVERGSDADEDN